MKIMNGSFVAVFTKQKIKKKYFNDSSPNVVCLNVSMEHEKGSKPFLAAF